MLSLPLTLALALTPGADAESHVWPQWRGPDRDGKSSETGLLEKWPADGPKQLWVRDGLGEGYGTPSIAGGRVFGMGAVNGNDVVWCVRADNGKPLWSQAIARKEQDGPRSTPTVDGGFVYALSTSGVLACLDGNTGKLVWKKDYKSDLGGRMMSGWGYCESVLIDGDRVVCTPGGDKAALAALNKKTGEFIWKATIPEAGGAGYASVVTATVGDTKVYVTWLGSGIVGVRASDGKFLWRYDRNANGTANIPTPIVKGEYVFCSTAYGAGTALLKQVPNSDGGIDVEEQYFIDSNKVQNHHGGMILVGDHVYLGSGHNQGFPRCVELMTGKQVWPEERGPGGGSAGIVFADGKLYFRYDNGVLALIEADPEELTVISEFKLPHRSGSPGWPHPVIADGKLYIRDQGKMVCFDVKR